MKSVDLKSIEAKIKEIRAYCDEPGCEMEDDMCSGCQDMQWQIGYLQEELGYLYRYLQGLADQLFQHANDGHLPPILGPDKLAKALKVLGLDGDYEVQKRQVWASTGKLQSTSIILKSK